jgi:hypothetical protein
MKAHRGTKPAHLADEEEHMASASAQLENPGTVAACSPANHFLGEAVKELEAAYESWFHGYLDQPGKSWGVYSPTGNGFAVRFADKKEISTAFGNMRQVLMHFAFFPETKVPSHLRFRSDRDAILSDWAMIGSDLYGAIQQYRIETPSVRTDRETARNPATTAR